MPDIISTELGDITIRRHKLAKHIRLNIAPDGALRISAPVNTPLFVIKAFLKTSRKDIRRIYGAHLSKFSYTHNQQIGKSHDLIIQPTEGATTIRLSGTHIIAQINATDDIASATIQQTIRAKILTVLRKEAKSYLPSRLKILANTHGFSYQRSKITHASSRWGSCSSNGTISLNIGLMNLPFELIDYVIIHELCHTRHMNHSTAFWAEVAKFDPQYKSHRHALKNYSPHV